LGDAGKSDERFQDDLLPLEVRVISALFLAFSRVNDLCYRVKGSTPPCDSIFLRREARAAGTVFTKQRKVLGSRWGTKLGLLGQS
jgi:hypothetical protein